MSQHTTSVGLSRHSSSINIKPAVDPATPISQRQRSMSELVLPQSVVPDMIPPQHLWYPPNDPQVPLQVTMTAFPQAYQPRVLPRFASSITGPFPEQEALDYHQVFPNFAGDPLVPLTHLPHSQDWQLTAGPVNTGIDRKEDRPIFVPRPHPHLPSSSLFITNIPPDLPDATIVQALRECLPVRVKLDQITDRIDGKVDPNQIRRGGFLQFDDMYNVEKAMATLPVHPFIIERGIFISPYPFPLILPSPHTPVPARCLQPTKLSGPAETTIIDPLTNGFMSLCPSPGELFDAVRQWGSIRQVSVWAHASSESPARNPFGNLTWGARVEFWFETEARRFEVGFGQTGSVIKGWQLMICAENLDASIPAGGSMACLPPIPTPLGPSVPLSAQPPVLTHQAVGFPLRRHQIPRGASTTPLTIHTAPGFAPVAFPQSPSTNSFSPMWTSGASNWAQPDLPLSPPWYSPGHFALAGSPISPPPALERTRHRSNSSKASPNSLRATMHCRQRTWSVTIDDAPGGGIHTTGIVADDGTHIAHGPGQHIRPAPNWGPGSHSMSGLVDYSNIYVKNLNFDVTSDHLAEVFEPIGRIVSARVMRDEQGSSRGYGFVSFRTPEEAAKAVATMSGTIVSRQKITVTLHEPRKLRPEKMAERQVQGISVGHGRPTSMNRRSSSPIRTDRKARSARSSYDLRVSSIADDIRSFSPDSRQTALRKRLVVRVGQFSRKGGIPEGFIDPTVKALVGYDIALLPLLSDPTQLDAKIAETIGVLQGDPELNMNLGILQPGLYSTVNSLDRDDVARLRAEVERVDPIHLDLVMDLILAKLTADELDYCFISKGFLMSRYNIAKKEVIQWEDIQKSAAASRDQKDNGDLKAETLLQSEDAPSRLFPPTGASSDDIDSIRTLACLPIQDIIAHLTGPNGDAMLHHLGIARPSNKEIISATIWSQAVVAKPLSMRKTEIAERVMKRLKTMLFRRSQQLTIVKQLVQDEENEEALCQLMLYPTILAAKVMAYLDKSKRRASH